MSKHLKIATNLALAWAVELLFYPFSVLAADPIRNPAPGYFVDLSTLGKQNTFEGLFIYLIQGLLGVAGLLAVFFIIYGGFQYLTSRGDQELAESGKRTVTNAIIGLAIIIFSYVIVVVIANALIRGQAGV